jgi:hypothetical protein
MARIAYVDCAPQPTPLHPTPAAPSRPDVAGPEPDGNLPKSRMQTPIGH